MAETNKKRTVAVLGWYGHQNFGDEVVLEGLRQLFHGWDVTVFSDNQKSAYPMINFDVVNTHDLFVLGGGELINADRLFINSPWVHKIKIPKIILGCGVNAEKPKQLRREVVRDLEQFSYIGLRDKTAVDILSGVPQLKDRVGLFYDLAFALDTKGYAWRGNSDMALVVPTDRVNNKYDRGIQVCKVADKSEVWLRQRLAAFGSAVFLPFGREDNDDYKTCLKLACKCSKKSAVLYPSLLSVERVLKLISEASVVYPYRLHGLVLSFILGARFEFYPYHWKLRRVFESVWGVNPNVIRAEQRLLFDEVINGVIDGCGVKVAPCVRGGLSG